MGIKNNRSKLLFYEGWEMECCGEPIHIGDKFEEEVIALSSEKRFNADYYFDNHGNHSFNPDRSVLISGTVKSILAIWSDNEDKVVQVGCADGKEDVGPEGEDYLSGYLIELV